jgi:hypothetical protein
VYSASGKGSQAAAAIRARPIGVIAAEPFREIRQGGSRLGDPFALMVEVGDVGDLARDGGRLRREPLVLILQAFDVVFEQTSRSSR